MLKLVITLSDDGQVYVYTDHPLFANKAELDIRLVDNSVPQDTAGYQKHDKDDYFVDGGIYEIGAEYDPEFVGWVHGLPSSETLEE